MTETPRIKWTRPAGWPIRLQLTAFTSVLIAAIAAFMFTYFPSRLESRAMTGLHDKAKAIVDLAAYGAAPSLVFGDSLGLADAVAGIQARPDFRYLVITELSGRPILDAAAPGLAVGSRMPDGIQATPAGDVYFVSAPARHNGIPVGALSLGLSLEEVRAEVRHTRNTAALATLVVLIVSIFAVYLIGHVVTRPVAAIVTTARKVAAGDLTERVQVELDSEIGRVGAAMNTMLDSLASTQEELKEINAHLEERVLERTAELTSAKDALERSRDSAEAANRAKSEFLANMSHEIRTPMNGVLGMLELTLDSELSAQQRDYLDTAKNSADALLRVINDILDFSKVEAKMMRLDPSQFSSRELVEGAADAFAVAAAEKGLEIVATVGAEVPAYLIGDAGRLRQILNNLIGNAIKFTPSGEVVVRMSIVDQVGAQVMARFDISDTGIGVAPDAIRRIFTPFAQADGSTTRKFGGTGLGLSIASQLVGLMGGTISVTSEIGQGSTFSFTALLDRAIGSPPNEITAAPELAGIRALIVDDNATNRRVLAGTLQVLGLTSVAVEDGAAAIQAVRAAEAAGSPFPLIIVDAQMPGMDGFELIAQINAMADVTKGVIMMLSSIDAPSGQARCNDLGVERFLMKPVRRSELVDAIGSALGQRKRPAPAQPAVARAALALRVLLVEDNPVNRAVAVAMLKKRGHVVATAENGRLGVEAYRNGRFDVILMDVQMPEMGGYEATAEIRAIETTTGVRTPIVAMTAHAMAGDRERCLEAGMDGYVSKPVRSEELIREVEGWAELG